MLNYGIAPGDYVDSENPTAEQENNGNSFSELPPLHRRPGESLRANQALRDYALLGPGRSIRKLLEKYKSSKNPPGSTPPTLRQGTIEKWSSQFSWQARVAAWEQTLAAEDELLWVERRRKGREDEWDQGTALMSLASSILAEGPKFLHSTRRYDKALNREIITVSLDGHLAVKALEAASKLRRLATGDTAGNVEISGKGDLSASSSFVFPADSISSPFLNAYRDIRDHKHTEYIFYGGRGSTKSSFISLVIIYLLKNNPGVHALATRQVANTLRDSVYSQLLWAISELGLDDDFKCTVSPLEIQYKPTGQTIYFRGADDPAKIKSIKPPFGHIGILWFEELDQFHGEESIRKIEQSVIRGGDLAYIFKSFNPPRTANNWANKYVKIPKESQYQHRSNYLDVPPEWLGRAFLDEAEHLKVVNPKAYEHEYLGIANSAGGLVFENVRIEKIPDEQLAQFDHVLNGLDWGFYPDPAHYTRCHYDAARLTLYIFGELRRTKTRNRQLYDDLVALGLTSEEVITADSAENKSVADFRQYASEGIPLLGPDGKPVLTKGQPVMVFGPTCRGAEKGPESVKYSMKWLQSLTAIVIDPERCPETAEEFLAYEYEQDKDGNFISEYPDKDNHAIDSVRYGTNLIWRRRGQ